MESVYFAQQCHSRGCGSVCVLSVCVCVCACAGKSECVRECTVCVRACVFIVFNMCVCVRVFFVRSGVSSLWVIFYVWRAVLECSRRFQKVLDRRTAMARYRMRWNTHSCWDRLPRGLSCSVDDLERRGSHVSVVTRTFNVRFSFEGDETVHTS